MYDPQNATATCSFCTCPEDFTIAPFSGQFSWVHDYVLKENSFCLSLISMNFEDIELQMKH